MFEPVGSYQGAMPYLGFGDELYVDYDPKTGRLRVSVFENNHRQDEAIIHLNRYIRMR